MPIATSPKLEDHEIEALLYDARIGESSDLIENINLFAKNLSTAPAIILAAAVDPDTGNGVLHMASANGHTDTLKELLKISAPNHTLSLDLQNASGNTALHWATLNGQLDAVKLLVEAGADVTVCNKAGHDALFAAEANDRTAVAEWLLKSAKGVASVIAGSRGREREVEAMASDEAQASDGMEKKEETMKDEEPKGA